MGDGLDPEDFDVEAFRVIYIEQLEADRDRWLDIAGELAGVVRDVEAQPGEAQRIMRENGLVIDDLDDPMQKLAFTFYSDLAELASKAEAALARFDAVRGE